MAILGYLFGNTMGRVIDGDYVGRHVCYTNFTSIPGSDYANLTMKSITTNAITSCIIRFVPTNS